MSNTVDTIFDLNPPVHGRGRLRVDNRSTFGNHGQVAVFVNDNALGVLLSGEEKRRLANVLTGGVEPKYPVGSFIKTRYYGVGIVVSEEEYTVAVGPDDLSYVLNARFPQRTDLLGPTGQYDAWSQPDPKDVEPASLDEFIQQVQNSIPTGSSVNEDLIRIAIKRKLPISFRYAKSQESPIEDRALEPKHLVLTHEDQWVVHGWDPDRQENRAYRLDRIKGNVSLS